MPVYTETELHKALGQQESWLKDQPGLVGHGVGLDRGGAVVIKVFSNGMPKPTQAAIASRFGDLPVVIEDHGEIVLQANE